MRADNCRRFSRELLEIRGAGKLLTGDGLPEVGR